MARNKYPEQTVERILTVSAKLFMQKGYEKTTMQDILDELKLSKGAIYHHFKSKEEIMTVVIEHWQRRETSLVSELAKRAYGANGKEKMRNLMMDYLLGIGEIYGSDAEEFFLIPPQSRQILMNGDMILAGMTSWTRDIAPIFAKLIEEGVADGSLQTEHPLEMAEIIILLMGLWAKPTVLSLDEGQTRQRLYALKDMLCKTGVDIFTDEMIEMLIAEYRRLYFFNGSDDRRFGKQSVRLR